MRPGVIEPVCCCLEAIRDCPRVGDACGVGGLSPCAQGSVGEKYLVAGNRLDTSYSLAYTYG